MKDTCEVPCKPVGDAIEVIRKLVGEKVSFKILICVIAGIMAISGVLLNAKMETIGTQIKAMGTIFEVSMQNVTREVRSLRCCCPDYVRE